MKHQHSTVWRRGLAVFLAFASSSFIIGQEKKQEAVILRLDPDKAVQLAVENNLGMKSGQLDVSIKKRKADSSWNVFIPTVDLGATMGHWNEAKKVSGIAPAPTPMGFAFYSATAPEWFASASIRTQLVLNAALFEGLKNLKLDYEAGVLSYESARFKLERDVRKSFYSILLLKENIALMESNVSAAEKRAAQAEANYRSGLIPELSYLQARVAAANLKPGLEEMKNGLDASLAAFTMNLGLPRHSRIELETSLLPEFLALDPDRLISQAAADRPDLLNLRQSIKLLDSTKKMTLHRFYTPSLVLGWNMDPSFSGDPFKDDLFNGSLWKQQSGMFNATLSFNLDGLLPFSKNTQTIRELEDNRKKLELALALSTRGMETEIDSLVQKLEKSRSSVTALAMNAELAERAYQLAEAAYRAGTRDLLDTQNTELELRKAQLEILKEKFNYITGLLDLEFAMGVPFGTLAKGSLDKNSPAKKAK